MKILIIPGHGGKDPGAIAKTGEQEKDLALDVSRKLADALRAMGHDVLLSRDGDEYVAPADQLAMIRTESPDISIALHLNASANQNAHGIETFYRDINDIELAGAIHDSLVSETNMKDNGIQQDLAYLHRQLAVLSDFETPSCLVEIGYISNPGDLSTIKQDKDIIAQAIAQGVATWAA